MLDNAKYLVKVGDGQCEEILTYNEILSHTDKKENPDDNDQTFTFESILDHCRGRKNMKFWCSGVLVKRPGNLSE